ncbi:hypothetical protein EPA93_01835 [Ktedonosporobacter rubrisoli]|uniref:Bacteriocin fulvocin C-related protein n=1 Tax=Ktedonosporobacter rubrisoli TaxID=2509675 RepID=A0A4P6JIR2_KTERU|nr:bacteriocin fulvocin C-related protein [Ktedonosporobacter rubrisoli]QBD74800.1 hypothetical protein EPA93_01835 [Ktedonosporobacter rubrisoli]
MSHSNTRWVLAFNASCGTCRAISERVAQACDGKLEVLPLTDSKVEEWREQALGPQAPWAPTLLRVSEQDSQVQAWTGPAMGIWLVRRLGLKSTMRVLAALERLRRGEEEQLAKPVNEGVIGRAQFLKLCAGGVVAAGLIMMGKVPAFAAGDGKLWAEAQAWVKANQDHLPATYDELIARPMAYRKAIYRASPLSVRARFWEEQLKRFRAAHPNCTPEQEAFLERAHQLVRTNFASLTDADKKAAIDAFGKEQAHALFATLGPAESTPAMSPARPADDVCNCTVGHDWCSDSTCHWYSCAQEGGCGAFWQYTCNGLCG